MKCSPHTVTGGLAQIFHNHPQQTSWHLDMVGLGYSIILITLSVIAPSYGFTQIFQHYSSILHLDMDLPRYSITTLILLHLDMAGLSRLCHQGVLQGTGLPWISQSLNGKRWAKVNVSFQRQTYAMVYCCYRRRTKMGKSA